MTETHAPIPPDTKCLAIIMPSWVGDTIMATPVLDTARAALPEARIVALVREGFDELLDGLASIDAARTCSIKGWRGPGRAGAALRATSAEAVLVLPNSFRSALAARRPSQQSG